MKLIKLAKKLDFETEEQYFDYCIDSHINGNFSQCERLFKDMTKQDKKRLISYLQETSHKDIEKFYFNLL